MWTRAPSFAPLCLQLKSLSDSTAGIPELSAHLVQLTGQILQREVGSLMQRPDVDPMDGTRPHTKGCLQHLHVIDHILKLRPPDVTTQFSCHPQV